MVSNAFRERLNNWPNMKSRDSQDLRKLSDFLQQCQAAMQVNKDLTVLMTLWKTKSYFPSYQIGLLLDGLEWLIHTKRKT